MTGALLDLEITGIAHGGVFVARHEGRVVFVADAVPGERVRARVSDDARSSFWRADTVEVLDASPHRRPHLWAEADVSRDPAARPGGADLGHIAPAEQRRLKGTVLAEALERFAGGGLSAPSVDELPVARPGGTSETGGAAEGAGWRTRMTVHVDAAGRIGPYAARSRRVIPVGAYPLSRPAVAEVALGLRGERPGRIELIEPADGAVRVRRLPEDGSRPPRETVVEQVGARRFRVDAGGFWQVHPQAATVLGETVRSMLIGRVDPALVHLDLYGGVGLFAAALRDLGGRAIVTVESDRRATAHAEANVRGVTGVTARVDRWLPSAELSRPVGAVVLDPPRVGAGRRVVEGLVALAPQAVVYVACDPVALARDLATFRALGWECAELRAFDLFPHSHHFESVALLLPPAAG